MDPALIAFLAIAAVLVVLLFGGKVKFGEVIEVDTEGALASIRKAAQDKHLPEPGKDIIDAFKKRGRTRLPVATIVWVDDHLLNNLYERQSLARVGIFVDSYVTNAEALSALSLSSYDVVVSDIGRGGQAETGWDLLSSVRKTFPGLPFVFYTIGTSVDDRARAEAQNAVITQTPSELFSAISRAVAR